MDLRPQGHDIIRTWLFSTIVRSHLEHGRLPWAHAAISGWVLDPDRKKMSKSVGNVVTPRDLLEKHGSDAARYWAASGRPGADTAFVEDQMVVGRKLAVKILNASRFVLSPRLWSGEDGTEPGPAAAAAAAALAAASAPVLEPVDAAILASLDHLVTAATQAFEGYDYARALERTESWFWDFCDNYLELVKARAYGEMGAGRAASARAALARSLSALLRLFAPFMPFVTEEVWSWWQQGSVHTSAWPDAGSPGASQPDAYVAAVEVLAAVRRAKSDSKVGPRAAVARARYAGARYQLLRQAQDDLRAAQNISELVLEDAEATVVEVELA